MKIPWEKIKTPVSQVCQSAVALWMWASMKKKRWGLFALDFLWFFSIVLLMGQIGPIINILKAMWGGAELAPEVVRSASKGDLITCSTAILASGLYFLIREYHRRSKIIAFLTFKSILFFFAFVFGVPSILLSSELLANPGFSSSFEEASHWIVYGGGIVVATLLWLIDELEVTAKEAVEESNREAAALTKQSGATVTKGGARV